MKYCATCKVVYPVDFQCCPKDGTTLSSSSEYQPGMLIREKYQILQRIGSGGMATVYQVRHLVFNEIKAIKLINSQLADGDQFIKRLRSEAVTARRLQHPNAVHVDDLDRTEDGRPFIVMEYVEGRNLRSVIREEGPLPTMRALSISAQVASALAAAHKLGITHRDIKPDNIQLIPMPDGSDFVKVLDFGIAKFTQAGSSSAPLTASGLLVGTPQYVSPEQAMGRHGAELDGRSDLYALGIVLYEMLTGRVPFDSDTPVGLLVQHLHTAPIPPDQLRPDLGIPHSVSTVLMKALEKNPKDRFHDAEEMRAAILALQEDLQRPPAAQTPDLHVEVAAESKKLTEQTSLPDTATSTHRAPVVDAVVPTKPPLEPASLVEPSPEPEPPPYVEPAPLLEVRTPHDVRNELLRAADEGQFSQNRRYLPIAALAVLCLIILILIIHPWRSASEKAAAPPAQEPRSQTSSQPSTSAPAEPVINKAAPVDRQSVPEPATQPPIVSGQNPAAPVSSSNPLDQETRAKIKELVSQGKSLSDQGEYQAAIEKFDSALKLDPQNTEAKAGRRQAKQRMELEQTLPNEAK
jgi:serine/threonine protein kinase